MKRRLLMTILTLTLALCSIFALTACGNGEAKPYIIESEPTVKLDMDTFTLPEWQKRYYLETVVSNNSENTLKMYMTCKFGGEDTLLTSDEITIPAGSPMSYYLRIQVPLYLPNEVHDVVIHCDEIKPGEDGYITFENTNNENTEQGDNNNSKDDENVVFCEVNFNNVYDYSSVFIEVGSKIKLETLERSGYEFLGWEINGALKQGGEYITITNDVTCVAQWKELGAFKINYVLNGGEFYKHEGNNLPQEINHRMLPYTLPSPYGDNGNCFIKWTTDEAGNNEITKLTELKEYTLYAQYEPAENHFTYKYNEFLQGYEIVDFRGFAKSVEIPSTYRNIAVKRIVGGCFSNENNKLLTSIVIPDSVKTMNSEFRYCYSLTRVDYMGSIDQWAQIGFYTSRSNPLSCAQDLYINNDLVTDVVLTTATMVDDYAFYNCKSLKNVTIGNSVTSIGEYAFSGCTSLASIEIPESVTSIGHWAFYNCSSLTSIEIPESVTSIGGLAFYNCSSLTSIEIPESVTSIYGNSFEGCSNLKTMLIKSYDVANYVNVSDIIQNCTDVYIRADITITVSVYNVLFNNLGVEEIDGVEYYHYQIKE